MRTIVVGTRQSGLALTQTGQVVEQLRQICAEHQIECDFEIKKIVTKGDRILDVTLSKVGGKGLFVKEIQQALFAEEIDLAVHSLKDMPAELPEGLMIGAIPERVDPRDCLITTGDRTLRDLPLGAIVGTSSLRRACQLKAYRPDLEMRPIRGNIDSRMKKLTSEGLDAIILAAAGLQRMDWEHRISDYISPEICVPAVGQGALAIECRSDDDFVLELLKHYQHEPSALTITAERSFLGRLNGGCQVPIGAYATLEEPTGSATAPLLTMTGIVGSPDGSTLMKEMMRGVDPRELGLALADKLLERGADKLLAEFRVESVE